MSTKTLGWLGGARDCKKLGSGWDLVNSIPTLSKLGLFQTFAFLGLVLLSISVKRFSVSQMRDI